MSTSCCHSKLKWKGHETGIGQNFKTIAELKYFLFGGRFMLFSFDRFVNIQRRSRNTGGEFET